jgi:hypothetical protein
MFGSAATPGQPEGKQYVGELQTVMEGAPRVASENLKLAQRKMKRDCDVKVRARQLW